MRPSSMMWDSSAARSLQRIFLALLAGWLVTWGGIAALTALTVLWPHNHVPQILLAAWVLAAVAAVAASWADERKPNGRGHGFLLLVAPLHPLLRAGLAVHRARRARHR